VSLENNSILAVIPARGGSKSIKNKNLRKLMGVSLVGRACKLAKSIPWINHTIISTDDDVIKQEAIKYGAEAPFMRPDYLAGDAANSIDMWSHALESAEKHYKMQFDVTILLEPTSPLREIADIELTVETLIAENKSAAATVSKTPAHYTPHKTLTISDCGDIGFYLTDGVDYSLRQKIPAYYVVMECVTLFEGIHY